jgi:hypothetical protein
MHQQPPKAAIRAATRSTGQPSAAALGELSDDGGVRVNATRLGVSEPLVHRSYKPRALVEHVELRGEQQNAGRFPVLSDDEGLTGLRDPPEAHASFGLDVDMD